ncbi:hypothetical protein DSECCO2_643980 [anaerobic digester metagenome]
MFIEERALETLFTYLSGNKASTISLNIFSSFMKKYVMKIITNTAKPNSIIIDARELNISVITPTFTMFSNWLTKTPSTLKVGSSAGNHLCSIALK